MIGWPTGVYALALAQGLATVVACSSPACAQPEADVGWFCGTETPADVLAHQLAKVRAAGTRRALPSGLEVTMNPIATIDTAVWEPGRSLRVSFLNGSPDLQARVMATAAQWSAHASVKFVRVHAPPAEVRVEFVDRDAYRAAIGTRALDAARYPPEAPTMVLGRSVKVDAAEQVFNEFVLHEFGHVLGAVHEHQGPGATFDWDKEYVRKRLHELYGWGDQQVEDNVFFQFNPDVATGTFDPLSIMTYTIPRTFTRNKVGTKRNNALSPGDIARMQELYPFEARGQDAGPEVPP